MYPTTQGDIERILAGQRAFFAAHRTKSLSFRIAQLKKFKAAVCRYESRLSEAIMADLHKSYEEFYLTEISLVYQEINSHIRHLQRWARPRSVPTPLHLWPSKSRIMYEPLGVSLIIAPWNYPFQLLMNPLVGAISAGCCAVLKPSPGAPETSRVMGELIAETFDEQYIALTQGHREVNGWLLQQRFDLIFFTGSPSLGKTVMRAAAEHLTPVVLELGGKSPCIVDRDASLKVAARRIAWGKTVNAGQTCIAPDYLFIHHSVKEAFLREFRQAIERMFGQNPKESRYYPRIVSRQALERLQTLMRHGETVCGGEVDEAERYLAPTVIDHIRPDDPVMQEEIFGPVLPVMTFDDLREVLDYVNRHEKPLAFYYFGNSRKAREVLRQTTSGGGCINDTLMHVANHHLPFGGTGNSGMGKYHGRDSFLAFSNRRALVYSPVRFDLPVKYAPFRYFSWIKKLYFSRHEFVQKQKE
ncbi:MAG: aldehyde dehydrogenase [Tannerella sp.]|jgi:aldehyde dehydrogenase (NAD+)|nr:aldehyde dehydrogenase [Tannerella sp.]